MNHPRRLQIILHGKQAGNQQVRDAVGALRSEGHNINVRVTWEAGDTQRFTEQAVDAAECGEIDTVVGGGGDGTLNEMVDSALRYKASPACSFGLLPLGTANDFSRTAKIPADDLTAALRIACEAPATAIDVGEANDRIFVNMLTAGFGPKVTSETDPRLKAAIGGPAYLLSGLGRSLEFKPWHGTITAPDFEWSGLFLAMAVGNGRFAGGRMELCPKAELHDGLLDLSILPLLQGEKLKELLAELPSAGLQALEDRIIGAKAEHFTVTTDSPLPLSFDGEADVSDDFSVKIRKGALRFHLGN